MTINEKLATIQTKFKSKKSRFNSFGKYNFRSAEDLLEATKPFLLELGVSVVINGASSLGHRPFSHCSNRRFVGLRNSLTNRAEKSQC